ncbi:MULTISPECIES: hypothetical protein [Bacillus]|nr:MULTISPECIES: hypothetical protein [Bacillus]
MEVFCKFSSFLGLWMKYFGSIGENEQLIGENQESIGENGGLIGEN